MKVLKFSDMLRTEGHPEPDGRTAMCIRHLKLMGYHVVTVCTVVTLSVGLVGLEFTARSTLLRSCQASQFT